MKLPFKMSLLIFAAVLGASTAANASGFYIQEQSVSGQGSAFAGAQADARDATVLFNNPAAMTELSGAQMTFGTSMLLPSSKFTNQGSTTTFGPLSGGNGGNPFKATPVPNFYAATPLKDSRYWLGLSVTAPFGLANDYGTAWVGRYDSTKTRLATYDISPQLAMKVNNQLSISGGPDFQRASGTLEGAIPCASPAPGACNGGPNSATSDGLQRLKGDSWGVGFNIGALYKFNEQTSAGIHYRSGIQQQLKGTVNVVGDPASPFFGALPPGALGNFGANADLNLPGILEIGGKHQLNSQWTILGSANWVNWSRFKQLQVNLSNGTNSITPFNYKDSYMAALGTSYKMNDQWTFRGGLQFDKTPTQTEFRSTRAPDSNRYWVSLGSSYTVNQAFSIDAAATHIFMPNVNSDLTKTFYGFDTVNLTGKTENHVDILSLQGTYRF